MPLAHAPPTIAFATSSEFPSLTDDDRPILEGLAAAGVAAEPVCWDADVTWSDYAAVVVRSTWDYHVRIDAFRAWLDRLDRTRVPCWNPTSLLRWNLDKHYLAELEAKGVPTAPTLWLEPAQRLGPDDAAARVLATGWADVVVKPAVSAGAWETKRLARADVAAHAGWFGGLLATHTLLVQPFLPEIVSTGEYSFHFFGGEFSHAVVKRPRSGDFRVQWSHGGTQAAVAPSADLVAQARAALLAAPSPSLYARVDGIVRGGRLLLMELELIEPYLHLAEGPGSVDRFVRALLARR